MNIKKLHMTQMQRVVVYNHLQTLPGALRLTATDSWNKLETGATITAGNLISLGYIGMSRT